MTNKSTPYPSISHHGATVGVTGSCHELKMTPNSSILIDCGIFQGKDQSSHGKAHADNMEIDFPLDTVEALILTHCHIDHAGRIPWLIAAGFDKPIYCSIPSAKLVPIMLADAAFIGITKNRRLIKELIAKIESLLRPIPYEKWTKITPALKIRLQRAGHILGSAYVECDVIKANKKKPRRIIFSGDLGAPHAPLLPEPQAPQRCHTLVIESTYGDKCHEDRESRRSRLETVIKRCVEDNGVILIPAFSLGRTQELLYEIEFLINKNGKSWECMQIILDSPLAERVTDIYREMKPYWDDEAQQTLEAKRHPLTFKQLNEVTSHKAHKKLVEKLGDGTCPRIVIAASGMCNGGRISDYLLEYLEEPKTDIIFSGYQARGSVGRVIQKYAPTKGWVKIKGQKRTINAQIHVLGGYSAHADQQNLIDFAMGMKKKPKCIRIIHGDKKAKKTLSAEYKKRLPKCEVLIPKA